MQKHNLRVCIGVCKLFRSQNALEMMHEAISHACRKKHAPQECTCAFPLHICIGHVCVYLSIYLFIVWAPCGYCVCICLFCVQEHIHFVNLNVGYVLEKGAAKGYGANIPKGFLPYGYPIKPAGMLFQWRTPLCISGCWSWFT